MNYYNPYIFYPYPTSAPQVTSGILNGSLGKGNFSFSSLLNGAQKTLNFVNQTIPVVRQVTPMIQNAKTMFRLMNEFKKVETPITPETKTVKQNISETKIENNNTKNETVASNGPTFFI